MIKKHQGLPLESACPLRWLPYCSTLYLLFKLKVTQQLTSRCPPEATPLPLFPPCPFGHLPLPVYQSGLRLLLLPLLWKWKVTLLWSGWTTRSPHRCLTPSALYATVDGAGLVANRINVACLACCWPLKANVIESLTPSRGSNTSVHALKTPEGLWAPKTEEETEWKRERANRGQSRR